MERILVIGCGGAGKSTLARELGALLDLPVVHLDRHFWRSGWVETPPEEWAQAVAELIRPPRWVMDGNYSGTLPMRMRAADTILFLDFPRRVCLRHVLGRSWSYRGRTRPDLPEGCPEKIDLGFARWIWGFPRRSRPRVMAAIERHGHGRRVEIFRRKAEVHRFVESLRRATSA